MYNATIRGNSAYPRPSSGVGLRFKRKLGYFDFPELPFQGEQQNPLDNADIHKTLGGYPNAQTNPPYRQQREKLCRDRR